MAITLIIFVAMVVSYSLNKIPMALTSLLGMLLLVITGCIDGASVLSIIGSGTVIIMMAMFVISSGVSRTSFISKLFSKISKLSGKSFTGILASYVLVTFILGQFMPSTTAVIALVCPLVVQSCKEAGINPSKMLFSIALVTVSASWTITPIGPYAANYIESNGMLAEYGLGQYQFTIFDEMIDKLPCTIFAIVWAIFIAPGLSPDKNPGIKSDAVSAGVKTAPEKENLSAFQEYATLIVFLAVIVSLCFNSFGLPTWVIPSLGACAVVLLGVLKEKEAISGMGLDIIMIYVGAAALGNAFASTGAGDLIGKAVSVVIGTTKNSYLAGAVFFMASYIMTSLLYNRAVSKILIPIILAGSLSMGCDPRGLMRMCYIGSMCSLITPMATTAVPIIMGAGGYSQSDLVKMSILPAIGMCAVTVFTVMSRFPCW